MTLGSIFGGYAINTSAPVMCWGLMSYALVEPQSHTAHFLSLTEVERALFAQLTVPSIAPCPIGNLLDRLDDESRTNLVSALSDDSVAHAKIARAIRDEAQIAVADETVSEHRRGVCRCSSR